MSNVFNNNLCNIKYEKFQIGMTLTLIRIFLMHNKKYIILYLFLKNSNDLPFSACTKRSKNISITTSLFKLEYKSLLYFFIQRNTYFLHLKKLTD